MHTFCWVLWEGFDSYPNPNVSAVSLIVVVTVVPSAGVLGIPRVLKQTRHHQNQLHDTQWSSLPKPRPHRLLVAMINVWRSVKLVIKPCVVSGTARWYDSEWVDIHKRCKSRFKANTKCTKIANPKKTLTKGKMKRNSGPFWSPKTIANQETVQVLALQFHQRTCHPGWWPSLPGYKETSSDFCTSRFPGCFQPSLCFLNTTTCFCGP